ncbi:hypothetical protein C8R44DRAFT_751400 [Mycena epipterygia]|nr:hypothetical protein C8R44DRAFT_751400 [Mycena epipterygia]
MGKRKRKDNRRTDREEPPSISEVLQEVMFPASRISYYAYKALSHPEIREKKRVQMAERRAAAKAAKRRWDPPKKKKSVFVEPEEAHSDLDSPDFCGADVLNATNLWVLSRTPDPLHAPKSISGARDNGRTPSQMTTENLGVLALAAECVAAALEDDGDSILALANQLCSIRPMPAEANHWGDDHDLPEPPLLQTMGLERWDELYYWSEEVMLLNPANEWDRPAQLAFAKAKKSIQLSRLHDAAGDVIGI